MSKALNINFSDEKLDFDYLVFNLPRFRTQILKVAKIFHKYGFNSRTYNVDTKKYSTILYEKTFTQLDQTCSEKGLEFDLSPSNTEVELSIKMSRFE